MDKDTHETPVIFRRFRDGEIIAIFPTLPGTNSPDSCADYVHVGQHGHCDPHAVVGMTARAKPTEYAALFHELTAIGYRLKVIQRPSWAHRHIRQRAIDDMRKAG